MPNVIKKQVGMQVCYADGKHFPS